MGSKTPEIGWLPTARLTELQAFLEAEWQAGHVLARDAELLRWQHPRGGDELSFVGASEDGRLLGVLGLIPVRVGVRGEPVSGAWLTTWVVVPAARARRIGLELLEFALRQHEFTGTIGGNATTMTILRALRFRTAQALPRWIRPLDGAALRRLVPGAPDPRARAADGPPGFRARSWDPADAPAWDRYWESELAPTLVGTWRDAAYLDRRYVSHPRFEYHVQVVEGRAGPAGILVHREERVEGAGGTVIRVVEALGDEQAVAAAAAVLVARGCEAGAAFADFYCTSSRFARPLERAGFVAESELATEFPSRFQPLEERPRPLAYALRLASNEAGTLADTEIYFTRSDCDQDRPA